MDAAGLTTKQLASLTDTPLRTVESWAKGDRTPRGDNLRRVAEALGITRGAVLGDEAPKVAKAPEAVVAPAPAARTLSEIPAGDWEGLARFVADQFAKHEDAEMFRARADLAAREAERFAREADVIAHRSAERALEEVLSHGKLPPANSEGARVPVGPGEDRSRAPSPGGLPRPD